MNDVACCCKLSLFFLIYVRQGFVLWLFSSSGVPKSLVYWFIHVGRFVSFSCNCKLVSRHVLFCFARLCFPSMICFVLFFFREGGGGGLSCFSFVFMCFGCFWGVLVFILSVLCGLCGKPPFSSGALLCILTWNLSFDALSLIWCHFFASFLCKDLNEWNIENVTTFTCYIIFKNKHNL